MEDPQLFDIIELLVDLPNSHLSAGSQGAIVECFAEGEYEVEFANEEGETLALCTLSSEAFIVVWKANTKSWFSVSERLGAVLSRLSEERQQEVLEFARSVYSPGKSG
ncbi:DUF4926 domain-containing protein [Laspinema sp. A4]|uniref:DUF4926 domain-containing protein n=1 Tax=Laspinema sp. D2d TaxID=2953686 RepID=UPI0021BB68F6|nr:DUF4926 domain-containing protein [Laspinema sp. D2d]MCT7983459.1 DUF4926 domain-containing protein [Laspinema sp. D2d]